MLVQRVLGISRDGIRLFTWPSDHSSVVDLMAGLLTAMDDMAQETQKSRIKSIEFGNANVVMAGSEIANVVLFADKDLEEKLAMRIVRRLQRNFESEYKQQIIDFNGNVAVFRPFITNVLDLFDSFGIPILDVIYRMKDISDKNLELLLAADADGTILASDGEAQNPRQVAQAAMKLGELSKTECPDSHALIVFDSIGSIYCFFPVEKLNIYAVFSETKLGTGKWKIQGEMRIVEEIEKLRDRLDGISMFSLRGGNNAIADMNRLQNTQTRRMASIFKETRSILREVADTTPRVITIIQGDNCEIIYKIPQKIIGVAMHDFGISDMYELWKLTTLEVKARGRRIDRKRRVKSIIT